MIRHLVLCKISKAFSSENIDELKGVMLGLKDKIPSIHHCSWHKNSSIENLDKGFEYLFEVLFEDSKARQDYLDHPYHLDVVNNHLMPALENGTDSIIVFDHETSVSK